GIEQLDETQPPDAPRATEEFEQAIDEQRAASPATAPVAQDVDYEARLDEPRSWEAEASGDFIPPGSHDATSRSDDPVSEFDDLSEERGFDERPTSETREREVQDRHRNGIDDSLGSRSAAEP